MVEALRATRAERVVLEGVRDACGAGDELRWAEGSVEPAAGLSLFRAAAHRPRLHPPSAKRGEKPHATTGGAFDDRSHGGDATFRPLTVSIEDRVGLAATVRAAAGDDTAAPPPKNAAALRGSAEAYAATLADLAPDGSRLAAASVVAAFDDDDAYYDDD